MKTTASTNKNILLFLGIIGIVMAAIWQRFFDFGQIDDLFFDLWAVTHFCVAAIIAYFGFKLRFSQALLWSMAVVISIAYELLEFFSYQWFPALYVSSAETWLNVVSDMLFNLAGVIFGYILVQSEKKRKKTKKK